MAAPPQRHPDHDFLDEISHDTPFPPGLDYVSSDVSLVPVSTGSVSHPTSSAPSSPDLAPTPSQSWDSLSLYTRDVLPPPPPPETSRILAVMLGIALALTLIATVMAVVWVFRGSMSRSEPLVAVDTRDFEAIQRPAEPSAAATRRTLDTQPDPLVAIDTRPDGLELVDADTRRSVGYTPLNMTVPPDSGLNLRAKLGTRYSRRLVITPGAQAATFDLRRWVNPPRYRARRAPTPDAPTPKAPTPARQSATEAPKSGKGVWPTRNNAKTTRSGTGWGGGAKPSIGLIEDAEPALDILDD